MFIEQVLDCVIKVHRHWRAVVLANDNDGRRGFGMRQKLYRLSQAARVHFMTRIEPAWKEEVNFSNSLQSGDEKQFSCRETHEPLIVRKNGIQYYRHLRLCKMNRRIMHHRLFCTNKNEKKLCDPSCNLIKNYARSFY